ncbi:MULTISPECIES: protein transport protein HofC [Dickeya]|uniref:Type II secretion system protein F n=1 Tax=Dickeya zeae (strain Ech586) TaxID=590409 RepID=D2BWJ4_DICZ5|nr:MULTISPECIES: protein transport protein HofC [Dickeya]ACZ78347.1 Type II secretion system F domain protein [Dickeya parazeae Ech586]MBP2835368.1 protein transport protein HofC [Dickeya parazeae]UCZ73965.1 protein transport protein HofC [Dickeya zeae]
MAVQKLYYWQALRHDGEPCTGERIGFERGEIYQYLLELGYQPLRLKTGAYLTPRYWQGPQLSIIVRQLSTLLQAGLPLLDALELLGRQHEKAGWRCLLQDIRLQVSQGRPLSEVLSEYPTIFPVMCRSLVAVGELTGKLDECCARLADYQEMQRQLTGTVIKALRYPIFVVAVGLLVTLLMLTLVLPEFAELYASFGAPLPWLTRMMLALSDGINRHGVILFLLSGGILLGYRRLRRQNAEWQQREQRLLLKLPLLSTLIQSHCLGQIFHTLAMTQQAGLTLLSGLNAAATVNNPVYRQSLTEIQRQLEQGIPLGQAIHDEPLLYPAPCHQLISVGEETGALDQLFARLAGWYENHTRQFADTLTQTLEPLLLVVVGGLVGTLVIAMYLPIFQLGNVLAGA